MVPLHGSRAERAGEVDSAQAKIGYIRVAVAVKVTDGSSDRVDRSLRARETVGGPEPLVPSVSIPSQKLVYRPPLGRVLRASFRNHLGPRSALRSRVEQDTSESGSGRSRRPPKRWLREVETLRYTLCCPRYGKRWDKCP